MLPRENISIYRLVVLLALFPAIGNTQPQDTTTIPASPPRNIPELSLLTCVQRVLDYYPVLKKQHAHVEEALAQRALAAGGLFPRIQGLSSVVQTDNPVNVFGMLLNQRAFPESDFDVDNLNNPPHRTNFNFAFRGEMPLFNAFQTVSSIRSAGHTVEASRSQEDFVRMEAALVAVEAYLRVILWERNFALAEEIDRDSEKDIRQAEDLKKQGMILGADYYAAKVIGSHITQFRREADARRRTARILLNILMNDDPQKQYRVRGYLPREARANRELASWLRDAEQSRKDLAAVRAAIKAQEADVLRERASLLPRIGALGNVEENTHNLRNGGGSYLIGFQGKMDLADSTYYPRVRKAIAGLHALEEDEAQLKDAIARSLAEAYEKYEAVRFNIPVVLQAVGDVSEAVNLTAPLYREGRKSIKDLLEIRTYGLNTRTNADQLLNEAEMGYASLLFISGTLGEKELREMEHRLAEGEKK